MRHLGSLHKAEQAEETMSGVSQVNHTQHMCMYAYASSVMKARRRVFKLVVLRVLMQLGSDK